MVYHNDTIFPIDRIELIMKDMIGQVDIAT